MEHLEIEVKYFLPDPDPIRRRLLEAGGATEGRIFEHNCRYDDARQGLREQGRLLRLRRERQTLLTFKRPATAGGDQLKIYHEWEVAVSDADVMQRILDQLGYRPRQVYEKWRETVVVDAVCFCLDRLPFGDFLEIEGPADAIRPWSQRLALAWPRRILTNYLAIFERLKQELALPFDDVTFANFDGMKIDFGRYEPLFTAAPDPSQLTL